MEFDAAAGIGAPLRAASKLQPPRAEAGGIVRGDDAGVAAAEDPSQIARGTPPDGRRVSGRMREAGIEVRREFRQEGIERW